MLSPDPANGAFFADKPATPEAPEAQPAPEAVVTEAPASPSATHESAAGASAAMIDVPLGTLIFRAGLLGEEQLEDALREGMRTGQRLGEVLIGRGWLQERDLGRLLAGQKGLPFVDVSADDAEPAALDKLSEENAKLQVALPLRYEGGKLVVAVADPSNELMLENLRRTLGAPPELVVAPYAELVKAIAEAYERPRPEAPTEPEIVAVPETPEPETQPEQQVEVEVEPAPARPLPIVLQSKTSAPEPDAPQPDAQPEPEVERAPAPRPLPIMLRPKESAAESPPAPVSQPTPVPAPPVETPQVEEAVVYAIETTPAPEPSAPEQPAAQLAPEAMPEATPEPEPQAPAAQAPPAPELILELPTDWPPTGEDPPEEPAAPAPPPEAPAPEPPAQEEEAPTPAPPPEAPAPEPPAQEEPAALTAVILRLTDGTLLEVGKFPTVAEAAAEAQEVVIEIAAADRNGGWPFFAQRYLRPDLIVSVDLIEQGPVPVDGLRRSQR